MRFHPLSCIATITSGVVAKGQWLQKPKGVGTSHGMTGKYLVELERARNSSMLPAVIRCDADCKPHSQHSALASLTRQLEGKPNGKFQQYKEFDCGDIFTGLAIETDTENFDTLNATEGVVAVWPIKTVSLSRPITRSQIQPEDGYNNYSMHRWTGVDKLHATGIRGKGATVAIIDTGIDYTHQALGGCFGPGCKVIGGYDLVGPTWNQDDEKRWPKIPDNDPMDPDGHGTHVAGIIAAENDWLTGVAPDAQLLIYKVFPDRDERTDESVLIQAFCDAYSAGADVITASIGQPDGFVDNPWAMVASRIVSKGVVVTISAGNEGDVGPIYSGSGCNGHNVLSVAAANVTGNLSISMNDQHHPALPAYFTTWGPTNELLMKPDIAAPGLGVISTVLNHTYDEMSGSSMAAPYIAGVAALYISKHGGREMHGSSFGTTFAKRIMSSGRSLFWGGEERFLLNQTAPPFQVGSGLIDAWKVLHYDTQLTYEPFALLDTQLFRPTWRANITNQGSKPIVYSFSLEPQAGMNVLDEFNDGITTLNQLLPITIAPLVTLPRPVVVNPGDTETFEVLFELPKGVDTNRLPLYSGKIWVRGDSGENLAIPYGGAAYDTEKAFERMFTKEPSIYGAAERNWSWSFNVRRDSQDFMALSTQLSYPCFHLRWDIFDEYYDESLWSYPPQKGKDSYVGSATSLGNTENFWRFDPMLADTNDTVAFPMMRVTRSYQNYWWFGKFANGTQIAPGNYTMRFAALRPYGDPTISSHWDIMHKEQSKVQILPYNASNLGGSHPLRRY